MERKISAISSLINKKISSKELNKNNYISIKNMPSNLGEITQATSTPVDNIAEFRNVDAFLSQIGFYFKKIWFSNIYGCYSNDVLVIGANNHISDRYLYYVLNSNNFIDYYVTSCKKTKMHIGNKDALLDWKINVSTLDIQQHITIGW